jgi:hypothetical protein
MSHPRKFSAEKLVDLLRWALVGGLALACSVRNPATVRPAWFDSGYSWRGTTCATESTENRVAGVVTDEGWLVVPRAVVSVCERNDCERVAATDTTGLWCIEPPRFPVDLRIEHPAFPPRTLRVLRPVATLWIPLHFVGDIYPSPGDFGIRSAPYVQEQIDDAVSRRTR